jgi:hypothetical protein
MSSKKLLDDVDLDGYLRSNLWKMLSFLERESHGFDARNCKKVVEKLRSHLLFRCQFRTKPMKSNKVSFHIEWTSRALRAIPFKTILASDESINLFPASVDILRKIVVVRKLVNTLGSTVFNYSKVARNLDTSSKIRLETCPCRTMFHADFRLGEGCVLIGNMGIVKLKELRDLLSLGAKVRVRTGVDPTDALETAMYNFIRSLSALTEMDSQVFDNWSNFIENACKEKMKLAHIKHGKDETVVLSQVALKYLRHLQKNLVLVPVDKAANNIAFICKNFYTKTLHDELDGNTSQVYEVAEEGDFVVTARHVHTLESLYKIKAPQRLGYLYWLPKLHESPPSQRFIAGAAQCTTTPLSKLLSDCLTKILDTLREKDNDNIRKTSIRRFFVVKGFEEVAHFLPRWPKQGKQLAEWSLQTGDFSTMYTTIPHKDLIENFNLCLMRLGIRTM